MPAFNYISTLRTNCDPAEECIGEYCPPVVTCADFRDCLRAYLSGSLYYTPNVMVLSVSDFVVAGCPVCDTIDEELVQCGPVNLDASGCSINYRLFAWLSSCAIKADINTINQTEISFTIGGLFWGAEFAKTLTDADWATLCNWGWIDLAFVEQWANFGVTPECDLSSAVVRFRFAPEGTYGC